MGGFATLFDYQRVTHIFRFFRDENQRLNPTFFDAFWRQNIVFSEAALANGEQVNSRFVYETYFQGNPQATRRIHQAES